MFKADVYRIAIHSLGAILEEEHLAKMTIDKWNEENAEDRGLLFLQVPANSSDAPDLNLVIIDSIIDVTIVEKIIATDIPVVLLFSKYHDPKNSMQMELDEIESYRSKIQENCICIDYEGTKSFSNVLISILDSIIKN